MAKAVKKKAPSRARYEQRHPTVSCRVPRDVYDRLKAVKKAEGRSVADILKIGLGILEPQIKDKAEIIKKAYNSGRDDAYEEGYCDGALYYRVTYPCSVCGKWLEVTTEAEKEAIKQFMQQEGWGHKKCHEQRW